MEVLMQELLTTKQSKPVVVARLTVIRASGRRTIVEIREGSKFASFYRIYSQDGARRSTKKWIRTGSRSEASNLTALLERMKNFAAESNPVIHSQLRIIKRRAYKKLITARPDELGLTKTQRLPIYAPVVRAS
jgi:hypothetical protein